MITAKEMVLAMIGYALSGMIAGILGYNITHYRQSMKLEFYESTCRINDVRGDK
jgi:hypothetical protein